MTILPIIGAVVAVLGLLGVIAAAFAVVRSSATKASAAAWREEAEAQKARADRLEATVEDVKGTMTALAARVETLEADNRRLADLATGASAIRELTSLVKAQHQETVYLIGAMTTAPTRRTTPGSTE